MLSHSKMFKALWLFTVNSKFIFPLSLGLYMILITAHWLPYGCSGDSTICDRNMSLHLCHWLLDLANMPVPQIPHLQDCKIGMIDNKGPGRFDLNCNETIVSLYLSHFSVISFTGERVVFEYLTVISTVLPNGSICIV